MKVPTLSKGLIYLGGLGSPSMYFGSNLSSWGGAEGRVTELTSNYKGDNWQGGTVTPTFDSWWLSGGFKKPVKYSYSYIARPTNTDYFNSTLSKYTKKNSSEVEGELKLVEKVGSKNTSESLNGLTTKKFILVGVNRNSKEVELTGLVSLVKVGHKGIQKNCNSKTEQQKAIEGGYCDHVFFKKYYSESEKPGFIEKQLKNSSDKQVGVLGFKLQTDATLSVIFEGGKLNGTTEGGGGNETRWSRSGLVKVTYKKDSVAGRTTTERLFVGPPTSGGKKYPRPYVVIHDLIFTKGSIVGEKWKGAEGGNKSFIELGKSDTGSSNHFALASSPSTIQLDTKRQYYLWDPDYTHIKNGKLETKNGDKLPWNVHFELPYKTELVK
ncbi:hypothetical protein WEN_02450 [Mycoplasma wenyonii str. Massachusetts]|uniref:Uncharacterized protein n=1 Tax=Mycoplasma wenyonii (strain Massachusetts) TaxID=1197325 RepID=I6ZFA7_MYCWM|nr:hypothetical protein [Mycoplasma wenyonii]AFN65277.1 hypothetical protein WEN_02450 [Mycoplasma wenyonii str. Massachusetts]